LLEVRLTLLTDFLMIALRRVTVLSLVLIAVVDTG